ncbi:MAG: protein kinase [Patescibacteria group bacterium]
MSAKWVGGKGCRLDNLRTLEVLMFHPGAKLNNRYVISPDAPMDGGQARVFHAWDEVAGRDVAIKQPLVGSNAHIRARFKQEAEVHAMLEHPNILKMYGVESVTSHKQHNGVEIIPPDASSTEEIVVLEWVPGGFNLWHLIEMHRTASVLHKGLYRGSCVPMATALDILVQVANALVYIHDRGVIHRDLKPSNILLVEQGDGSFRAKVSDFGTAKDSDSNRLRKLTSTGQTLGSLGYMSWEQGFGKAVSASDVWSLIVTAYEAVTGCLPYSSHRLDTAQDCVDLWQLIKAGQVEIDPVERYCAGTPPSFINAIKLGLNPDPILRPSAAEVLRILTALRDDVQRLELAETQLSFTPISSRPPLVDKLAETQDAPAARQASSPTEQFFARTFELPAQPAPVKRAKVIIAQEVDSPPASRPSDAVHIPYREPRTVGVAQVPEVMVVRETYPSTPHAIMSYEQPPVSQPDPLPPPVVSAVQQVPSGYVPQSQIATQPPASELGGRPSAGLIMLLALLCAVAIAMALTVNTWLPYVVGQDEAAANTVNEPAPAATPVPATAQPTVYATAAPKPPAYVPPTYTIPAQPARTARPSAPSVTPARTRPATNGADTWIGGDGLPPGAPPPINQ